MNLKNFQFNSEYPIDKIVLLAEMYAPDINAVSTPHNLSDIPLIVGIWSTSSDFPSTRNCGMTRVGVDPVICWATKTHVFAQNYAYSGRPVWVRIYGFFSRESQATAPATSNKASKFVFNSEYRYMPLVGSYTVTNDQTIQHNLGYKPRVLAWIDYGSAEGHVEPIQESRPSFYDLTGDPSISVTNNSIRVIPANVPGSKVHLRIYG